MRMKLTTLPIYHNTPEHRLPIYCFLLYRSYVITCSQNEIRFHLQRNINGIKIDLELFQTMSLPGNILCAEISNDLLYFSGDNSILFVIKYFEAKNTFECVHQSLLGRLDINCMKIFNKYLITGGLDGILNIINVTNLQIIKQINMNEVLNHLNIKKVNKLIDDNTIYGLNVFNEHLIVFTVNRLFVFNNEFRPVFNKGDIFLGLNNELYFSKSSVADEGNYLIVPLCFMEGEHVVEILNKNFETVFSLCGHVKTIECVTVSNRVINNTHCETNKDPTIDNSVNETFETSFLSTETNSERRGEEIKKPEELLIATASQDKTLCIWSSASDKPLLVLKNFTLLPVMHMEFVGTVLICSSYDGYVKRLVFDEYTLSEDSKKSNNDNKGCVFKPFEMIGIADILPIKEPKSRNEINKIKQREENTEINMVALTQESRGQIEEEWKGLEEIFKPFSFENSISLRIDDMSNGKEDRGDLPLNDGFEVNSTVFTDPINKDDIKYDSISNKHNTKQEESEDGNKQTPVDEIREGGLKEKPKFKIISAIEETPKIFKTKKNTFLAIFKNTPPQMKGHEVIAASKYTKQCKLEEGETDTLEYKDFQIKPSSQNLKVYFQDKELYTINTGQKLLCFNLKYLIVYKEVLKIYNIKTGAILFPFMKFQKIFVLDILKDELLILLYDSINIMNLRTGKIMNRIPLPFGLLINCQFDTIYYLLITFKEEGTFYYNKERGMWNALDISLPNSNNIFSDEIYFETNETVVSQFSDTFDSLEYQFIKNLDLLKTKKTFHKKVFLIKNIKRVILKFVKLIYRDSVLEMKLEGFIKRLLKESKECGGFSESVDLMVEVCDILESKGLKQTAGDIWALVN